MKLHPMGDEILCKSKGKDVTKPFKDAKHSLTSYVNKENFLVGILDIKEGENIKVVDNLQLKTKCFVKKSCNKTRKKSDFF